MKILVLTLFMLIGMGCSQFNRDDILLQIGHYKLTVSEYEFIKRSAQYKDRSNGQLQGLLTEEGQIIAFALDHKYDTIGILKKQLDYAGYYYASKVDGYVWNKKVKPLLNVIEDDVQKAYQLRTHEYYLNLICFPDKELLLKYCKRNHPLKSEKDFFSMNKNISSDLDVRSYSELMRYPFSPLEFYNNKILEAKIGDVLGPFETLNGYYVIYVGDIKKVSQRSYEQEKNIIRQQLINGLKGKYIWESQQQIVSDTKPKMYDDAINEVASKMEADERKWSGINRDLLLMEYELNGVHQRYTVADFIEFVECQPLFFGSLSNPSDIKKMLKTNLINVCLFSEAQQMHIEEDADYQQFRKRYQHSILLHHYKQKNIYPNILIQDKDIMDYYQKHQNDLKCFESASVTVYSFKDIDDALKGKMQILSESGNRKNIEITKRIDELFTKIKDVDINMNGTNYDKQFLDIVSRLNVGQISAPFKVDNEYQIIQLSSKTGVATTPFEYVKDEIKQRLYSIKELEIMSQQVKELQKSYPVIINRMREYSKETYKSQ